MLCLQLKAGRDTTKNSIVNIAGGVDVSMSLWQLSDWCDGRFGAHDVRIEPKDRLFDIPWMVLDAKLAKEQWGWTPQRKIESILEELAVHAEKNSTWLDISAAY